MKFIRFTHDGKEGLAVLDGGEARGYLEDESNYPGSINEAILGGIFKLEEVGEYLKKGRVFYDNEIKYLTPILSVGKIICVGLNYLEHAHEGGFEVPKQPDIFARFSSSLTPHQSAILKPYGLNSLDYEGELAVVIGKSGRDISLDSALDYVSGYSIFNDASIREVQLSTSQWGLGKNFDRTGAFGPSLVTRDELPLGAEGLKLETRLNGKIVQSANTNQLMFNVKELIHLLSKVMTLEVGDIIVTGTPSGVGHARNPPIYMNKDDICEVEIEGLGVLRNIIEERND